MIPDDTTEVARFHDLSPGEVIRCPDGEDRQIVSVEFEGLTTVNVECSDDHILTGHIHEKILRLL